MLKKFDKISHYKIREFSQFIGSLVSCCPALRYSWMYTKNFERQKFEALLKNKNNYESIMKINLNKEDYFWWTSKISRGYNLIKDSVFELEIFSDASLSGWGAVSGSKKVSGLWKHSEKKHHINFLELQAAFFGLKCFAERLSNIDILLRIDNTTAVSYINRMGGIRYEKLNSITREIWQWCEKRNIWIFASYISSKDNFKADYESRRLEPDIEFELSNFAFECIITNFGIPEIDLFATRSNTKCSRYVSWKQDPGSEAIDAFTLNWKTYFFYAFSPFSLILSVLKKIKDDKAEGIVVIPDWPTQPWYPVFHSLLVKEPVVFNPDKKLLMNCCREPHPLWKSLTLVAGRLSGKHL